MQARLLQRPKVGESLEEMQDAAAVDGALGRAAVADGATDAAFQRLWATLLVQAWIAQPPIGQGAIPLDEWLAACRDAWRREVPWARLPWHGALKAEQSGGLATFMGLCAEPADDGALQVELLAVGDCDLLIVDGADRLRCAWPLSDAAAFSQTPALLSSLHPLPPDARERGMVCESSVVVAADERLVLGSDAVVQWLLRLAADGDYSFARSIAMLEAASADATSAGVSDGEPDSAAADHADALIAHARAAGLLRNDDLTLLILRPADAAG
jgi:hypothetical protein